jgi:hypothetical protein
MKYTKKTVITFLLFLPFLSFAQSNNDIVKNIQELMLENYIFLDKAKETNLHLDSLITTNYFETYTDPKDFAKALSVEMQKVTNDKHLNIAPPRPPRPPQNNSDFTSRHLTNLVRFRSGGFGKIDLLDGNVGYVQLKGFRREDIFKVDDVMNYLSTADAIIIDLRENGGGSGLGLYWSSYFLKDNTHLTGTYERRTDTKKELNTVSVKGNKRLDMPIFILTSNRTFSAAEAFAYDLQSRKRATIIGEITGGGAHPVDFMRLPKGYGLIVPYAESINPITKSNWEGVDVIPDFKTTKEESLTKAKELAIIAAKNYREQPFNELELILEKNDIIQGDEDKVFELIKLLLKRNHLEDFIINDMGYSYLENNKIIAAYVIFKSNVEIFPKSPNAHDSYADVLALKDNKKEALKHYKQAVLLAEKQNDSQLEMYKNNLLKFETKR